MTPLSGGQAADAEVERIGAEIFHRMADTRPALLSRASATGLLLAWSMRHERLRAQLFRLVDVLPALGSDRELARHIVEYLGGEEEGLPRNLRRLVGLARVVPALAGALARRAVRAMAKNYILAENPEDAVSKLSSLRGRRMAFTVDLLGETALSENEASVYAARYHDLLETLAAAAAGWPRDDFLDSDDRGPIPVVNVSVKVSALYSQLKPEALDDAIRNAGERLRPLLRRAMALGAFVNFDMEMRWQKDLTLRIFRSLLDEEEFRGFRHAGIAIQAYLRESEQDIRQLISWSSRRDVPIAVRLVKGAYWDTETVLASQKEWPVPVYAVKSETDAAYERLAKLLLENAGSIDFAFGTHNVRTIAACVASARERGLPDRRIEFQMLYGMAEPIKEALVKMGLRVREYCPLGAMLPGMAYLVRRLLENTSNEGFLRAAFAEKAAPEVLLRAPVESSFLKPDLSKEGFRNEPTADFARSEIRERMRVALRSVHSGLGQVFPLRIAASEVRSNAEIVSRNPARPEEIIGRVGAASRDDVAAAVGVAVSAFADWRALPAEARARLLDRAAELLGERRFELSAVEVFETGKIWREADADVCEAIDFCRYYALEMRRIARRETRFPGEAILHEYMPRGVAGVIAPWNFPLAILCGMTVAALVAGNPVILKPSGQSVVIACLFVRILQDAGIPPEVVQCLPGSGGEVGAALVEHPDVALIAFTGSRDVGLRIWEAAGRTPPGQRQLKKVICEMGGKNALIVDEDADLDEAVSAIVSSAFGYQGQKCSALSRLIVLPGVRAALVRRTIEATESLRIGDPADPAVSVGPLIDQAARDRVSGIIAEGRRIATPAFETGDLPGWFVGPAIFTGVDPKSALAQEEIFGPVLSVIDAADLDDALRLANATSFALTGGFFSRSPAAIERVKSGFLVGNLYVNRGITGALVGRHPFGGFGMSGAGTKAGGPDYLLNFLFPRVTAENVMRRGATPPEE